MSDILISLHGNLIGLDANNNLIINGSAASYGVNFGNGTAAAPTVSFASDTDTGFYRVSSNVLGVAAAGAQIAALSTAFMKLYSATSSKGDLKLLCADNAANYEITLTNASFGQATTITITDPGSATAKLLPIAATVGSNGIPVANNIPFNALLNTDGSVLSASASSGKFGYSFSLGTSGYVIGETSNNNTKTDDLLFEYTLPATYKAGTNLTATVYALIQTAGSPTYATKTIQVLAYRQGTDGTQGADIGPGSASAITVAGADITATITGTTLNPGDKVLFKVEGILHDTGAVDCNIAIGSIRIS